MEDPKTLLDIARTQTGLEDFGDPAFREGLEILVGSLRSEARLHVAGEAAWRERILRHLRQRLQIEAWYRRHPDIDEVPIRAPLFGLGLPRTGSSALSFLLAQDLETRSLRKWEASDPCPPPSTVEGPDPRRDAYEASPGMAWKSHVPTSDDGPMECQDLMALDFKAHIFQALAQIPTYSRWLLHADLTSTYLYERRALKLLQWGYPAKPWRLKAPTHTLFLPYLAHAFPEARFVMTHRDPTDVIPSVAAVYADIVGKFTDHVDRAYLGQLNIEHWQLGMQRAIAFRDKGADARFFDIDFRAMQVDPIAQVKRLYRWLGVAVTSDFEARMAAWWRENAETREPSSAADPASFGLDVDNIRRLFADYTARAEHWTTRDIGGRDDR